MHNKLMALPDETLVYPAHGAGSLCGKQLSSEALSTIGEQRKFNYALQPMSKEEFKRIVTADRPDLVATTARITAMAAYDLIRAQDDVRVIDVRAESEWNAGHIQNSRNVPLSQLQDRLAEIPSTGRVIVHCQGGYRSSIAASILQRQARTNVLDLVGGFAAWKGAQLPVAASAEAEV